MCVDWGTEMDHQPSASSSPTDSLPSVSLSAAVPSSVPPTVYPPPPSAESSGDGSVPPGPESAVSQPTDPPGGQSSAMSAPTQPSALVVKKARVCLPRTTYGHVHRLFFGKWTAVLDLSFKEGHPSGTFYSIDNFLSDQLHAELKVVANILGVQPSGNVICRLPSGLFVHVYGKNTVLCSHLKLASASEFFSFEQSVPELLPAATKVDIRPFLFAGQDLALSTASENSRSNSGAIVEYPWVTEQNISWDWNEDVWTGRMYECLQVSNIAGVRIVPAYKWTPRGYTSEISTLFPHVMDLRISPFHGMSDILILGQASVVVVRVAEQHRYVCAVEVGIHKEVTFPITIACMLKRWPDKVGELLASTYIFVTLNYVNSLKQLPWKLQFRSYGMLAIRTIGCIVLQYDIDSSGCHVKLLHEGGTFSMGNALEFIMKSVGGQDKAT